VKKIQHALRIMRIMLSEIFDEAAYARFLERTHSPSSPAAYAAFWRERDSQKIRPNRCC
jgi:hypothetical protein